MSPSSARHIVLVGMMGAGKSTVGRRLGALLGRRFVDTDAKVVDVAGRSIAEIFTAQGEAEFRKLESGVLVEALQSQEPSVLAVGGGAVLDPANRQLLGEACEVVWLRADAATLVERVAGLKERPLLGDDPASAVARIEAERRELYEELAQARVDVDTLGVDATVHAVIAAIQRRVEVDLGARRYEVLIGPGARHLVSRYVPDKARRAAVVTQAGVNVSVDTGLETDEFVIGLGERAKSFHTIEELCRGFARAGLHRDDVVLAVGGGVVGDVAGFAAACYHRGVEFINVATTLLAQVDSAIGGKTGVNLAEGKNLAGAFWQPRAVLCDTDTLATLPKREWVSGLGEMAKYELLGLDLASLPLVDRIAACVALKADVVSSDERDGGRRQLLNYGHTLAHALEGTKLADEGSEDWLRHGEAVGIGLVFAARLAKKLGRIKEERLVEHLAVVERAGLPTAVPEGVDDEQLIELMHADKKSSGGLTFVLDGPHGIEVVDDVPLDAVRATLGASRREGAP